MVAVVFARFINHGDFYPTTPVELAEMNNERHIWLSDDVENGTDILTPAGDMKRETVTWMVIAKIYNALTEHFVQTRIRVRTPISLRKRWLGLRRRHGRTEVTGALSWFHEHLFAFEERIGLWRVNPEKSEDDSLVLWNLSTNEQIRQELNDWSLGQKQLNVPVRNRSDFSIVEDILLVGVVSHYFLQRGGSERNREERQEKTVAAFLTCVQKAQFLGFSVERRSDSAINRRWETLKSERKAVNGIWALYEIWHHRFNRNGFFLPVVRPMDDISYRQETARLIDLMMKLLLENSRLQIE